MGFKGGKILEPAVGSSQTKFEEATKTASEMTDDELPAEWDKQTAPVTQEGAKPHSKNLLTKQGSRNKRSFFFKKYFKKIHCAKKLSKNIKKIF